MQFSLKVERMAYNVPAAIRRLPFNLLRSQLFPRDPDTVGEAIEEYTEPRPAMYLPQHMRFTEYKTPPVPVAWGQNAQGYVSAVESQQQYLPQTRVGVPLSAVMSRSGATRRMGLDDLPIEEIDPNLNRVPAGRNVLPENRMLLHADELNAIARNAQQNMHDGLTANTVKREYARAQVDLQLEEINRRVFGR